MRQVPMFDAMAVRFERAIWIDAPAALAGRARA